MSPKIIYLSYQYTYTCKHLNKCYLYRLKRIDLSEYFKCLFSYIQTLNGKRFKMFSIILLLIAVSLLGYAFYKWATLNNDYFLRKGVSFRKPTFLFGNSANILLKKLALVDYVNWHYNQFPDKRSVFLIKKFHNFCYYFILFLE